MTESGSAPYDEIGRTYAATRHEDPRIAAVIRRALGPAERVLNVGAGSGSYEPRVRSVIAAEPSEMMIAQRPDHAAPVVRAVAERLPFKDGSFDAGMGILTLHHWTDWRGGLRELRRVGTNKIVLVTWDPDAAESFWLVREYFPAIGELERGRSPGISDILSELGGGDVRPLPIPHDCEDGFTRAFWRRPEAYLDAKVRAGMSTFQLIGDRALENGLRRLESDLSGGVWIERFGELLDLEELDLGYRLVVSSSRGG